MAQTSTMARPQAGAAGGSRIIAIVAMMFLFAMISFVTNLAAPLGTVWKNHYAWAGMFGNMMNFLAYLLMGIPAGAMLVRIGYKRTALWAIAVGIVGLVLQWLSGVCGSETPSGLVIDGVPVMMDFIVYLLGAFVAGFCVCMLNTVVNPMLNLLGGGGNHGNQLVQVGGAGNSLTGTATPLLIGMLVGTITPATTIGDINVLLYIAVGVFIVTFIAIGLAPIPEPQSSKPAATQGGRQFSPWSFRHTVLGVIGIFLYVGIEVGIPGVLIFWLSDYQVSGLNPDNAVAVAGGVAACYWLLMLCGRLISSVISGKVSSRVQLIFVSTVAIFLLAAAIFMPVELRVSVPSYSVESGFSLENVPMGALFLVLCGLCTSVMWGGIYNLAVEGLGRYTAQASGIFMMMVVGGGVMPLIQNWLAGAVGYMGSYWLVIAMMGYLLFYGCIGCQNVNGDIPVTDDTPMDERDL